MSSNIHAPVYGLNLINSSRKRDKILWTFIKLPFVIKIFVLPIFECPFYTSLTVTFFSTCREKKKQKVRKKEENRVPDYVIVKEGSKAGMDLLKDKLGYTYTMRKVINVVL